MELFYSISFFSVDLAKFCVSSTGCDKRYAHYDYDPVCGTDQKTYGHECYLKLAACGYWYGGSSSGGLARNTALKVQYKGECNEMKGNKAPSKSISYSNNFKLIISRICLNLTV